MKKTVKLPVVWIRNVAVRLIGMLALALLIEGISGVPHGFVAADDVGTGTFVAALQDESEPAKQGDESQADQVEEPRGVRDESSGIDPANKDALAWYMSGHKALNMHILHHL